MRNIINDNPTFKIRRKVEFNCICGAVKMVRADSRQKYCSQKCPNLLELRPQHIRSAIAARLNSPIAAESSARMGRLRMANPEFRRKIAAARNASPKCKESAIQKLREYCNTPSGIAKRMASQKWRESASLVAKTILHAPAVRADCIKRSILSSQKTWLLKSPRNIVFEVRNLNQFIRDNPSLFELDDVAWSSRDGCALRMCRASAGIGALRPTRKHPNGSWKGWTWVSIVERLEGCVALDVDKESK